MFVYVALSKGQATQSCTEKLALAETVYKNGSLERVADIIETYCLKGGFSQSDKLKAYRLLVLSSVYLDKKKKAKEFLFDMLVAEPEYQTSLNETKDFIQLYNEFKIIPWVSLGFFVGSNLVEPQLIQNYGVDNSQNNNQNYTSSFSFQAGFSAEILLYNTLFAVLSPQYISYRFTLKDELLAFTEFTNEENNSWLKLPVFIRYGLLPQKKIRPYIQLGCSLDFMSSASGQFARKVVGSSDVTGVTEDLKNLRKNPNYSISAGVGVKLKVRNAYFFLEALYTYGLLNQANPAKRYDATNGDSSLIYRYGYIENDYRFNAVSVSFGFMHSFYRVKNRKKKTKK